MRCIDYSRWALLRRSFKDELLIAILLCWNTSSCKQLKTCVSRALYTITLARPGECYTCSSCSWQWSCNSRTLSRRLCHWFVKSCLALTCIRLNAASNCPLCTKTSATPAIIKCACRFQPAALKHVAAAPLRSIQSSCSRIHHSSITSIWRWNDAHQRNMHVKGLGWASCEGCHQILVSFLHAAKHVAVKILYHSDQQVLRRHF